eukprot:5406222-Prorocentrum_lima.AAC.1
MANSGKNKGSTRQTRRTDSNLLPEQEGKKDRLHTSNRQTLDTHEASYNRRTRMDATQHGTLPIPQDSTSNSTHHNKEKGRA